MRLQIFDNIISYFIEQMLLKYAKQRYQVNINDSAEYPYEAEYQYLIK